MQKNKKPHPYLIYAMLVLLFILLIIGIVLSLYSYLVPIVGKNNEVWSLAKSPYNFNSKFFSIKTYNTMIFPQIPYLLRSLKVGIVLTIVSGTLLGDYLLIKWLVLTSRLKNIFQN